MSTLHPAADSRRSSAVTTVTVPAAGPVPSLRLLIAANFGVGSGIRTRDLQGHNLAL
jgi:hypothetical protein